MSADQQAGEAAIIGRRLRELRSERELSLRQLARQIGASPSLLSQIENGKVSPSVDTLYQLASALGTPVASFFGEAPPSARPGSRSAGDTWIVRRDERQGIRLEHDVTWENLLPHEEPGLRFMEVHYPPGAHSGERFVREPGRQLILILAGALVFRVGFAEHVLRAGDAISFLGAQPHHLRNDGSVEARAIVCVTGEGAPERSTVRAPLAGGR